MKPVSQKSLAGPALRLFFYFLIPLTIVLMGIVLISQNIHHRDMEQLAGDRDLRAVQAAALTMENSLYTLQEDMTRGVEALSRGESFEQLIPWFHDFTRGTFLAACPTASILLPPEASQPPDTQTIDVLCQVLRSDTVPGTAYRLEQKETSILWIAQSVDVKDILVGGIDLDSLLEKSLFSPASADQFSIQIFDADHTLLFETGRSPVSDHELYHQGVLAGLDGKSGVLYPHGSHGSHIIAYAPIAPVGWVLMMDEAWQDVSPPSLQISQTVLLILVPVLLLALAGLLFAVRSVIQPLQRLADQTSRMESDPHNPFLESVGGIPEIKSLQETLRDMMDRLQEARQNLEQYIGGLTTSQEVERKNLSRELHDGAVQDLIALKKEMQHKGRDENAAKKIQQVIDSLRTFIRGLRPPYLDDLGWLPAIQTYIHEYEKETGINMVVTVDGEEIRLSLDKELVIYRVIQEALTNIRKHARASRVDIRVNFLPSGVRVQMEDDGVGFIMPEKVDHFAREGHYGLLGMKERIEMVGGRIDISSDPDNGTGIDFFISAE
jgi:signal transduction histidine kinase